MKYQRGYEALRVGQSPPSRGAWIEINGDVSDGPLDDVAPLAGGVD